MFVKNTLAINYIGILYTFCTAPYELVYPAGYPLTGTGLYIAETFIGATAGVAVGTSSGVATGKADKVTADTVCIWTDCTG